MRADDREVPRDRHPARRHRRTVRHRAGLRGHRLPRRRRARPVARRVPARRHPHRRCRPEQTADARRTIGRARPCPGTARLHRRRVRRQGPRDNRLSDAEYTIRQAGYDLRKLRGKQLIDKPARTRRYQVPPQAARTIAALLTLRDQVIAPILAGIRSPRMGRKPNAWTSIDCDYEQIRINMQTLFDDLALTTSAPLAA